MLCIFRLLKFHGSAGTPITPPPDQFLLKFDVVINKGDADLYVMRQRVEAFERHCGSLAPYGLKHTQTFADLCNSGVTTNAMDDAKRDMWVA
ncbi:hypothetical protein SSX86_021853 [Deinandra increscens subsp. villosa]|uniref:Legumain prodomain domain-containing protein n=1 Tax=Deinandra increscens subsp. villosa TaxID=3103831 RepID=A0AAP0GT05_9ASTR